MYSKLRVTLASLSLILLSTLTSTTTVAYFTDSDSTSSTFILGRADTVISAYDDVSSVPYTPFSADTYGPLVQDQEIPLYLSAENNGNIPVYQRFRLVLPITLASALTFNLPGCTLTPLAESPTDSTCTTESYTVIYHPSVNIENLPTYAIYYIYSNQPIAPGAATPEWPTTKIIVGNLDNVNPADFTCANNNLNSCAFGLSYYSDVIQTTGFSDPISAFQNFAETY